MVTGEEEGLSDFIVYFIREGNGIGNCLVIFTVPISKLCLYKDLVD